MTIQRVSLFTICTIFFALGPAVAQTTVTTPGGSTNSVPKFSGSSTIVNSAITENNGQVGIGTTNPQATLHVSGNNAPGAIIEAQDSLLFGSIVCCGAGPTGSSIGSSGGWSSFFNGAYFNSNGTATGGAGGAQLNSAVPSWRMALGSGTNEWPGGDNFVIARVPAGGNYAAPSILLSVNNSGQVKVAGGVDATGGGLKHARAGGCNAGNGTSCSVIVSWPGAAFSDTNYTAVCTPDNGRGGTFSITNKTTTSVTVTMVDNVVVSNNGGILGSTTGVVIGGVECMAMHD
ncbi:MAG TPA: hypothetical protein VG649_13670 [Candidatus Angelobacter sp.]|nr:hypothetical protein [Candidatus Angelobacter sp.]